MIARRENKGKRCCNFVSEKEICLNAVCRRSTVFTVEHWQIVWSTNIFLENEINRTISQTLTFYKRLLQLFFLLGIDHPFEVRKTCSVLRLHIIFTFVCFILFEFIRVFLSCFQFWNCGYYCLGSFISLRRINGR